MVLVTFLDVLECYCRSHLRLHERKSFFFSLFLFSLYFASIQLRCLDYQSELELKFLGGTILHLIFPKAFGFLRIWFSFKETTFKMCLIFYFSFFSSFVIKNLILIEFLDSL